MRAMLPSLALLLACGGSTTAQAPPPPLRPAKHRPTDHRPTVVDCAGAKAHKCLRGRKTSPVARALEEPQPEQKNAVPDAVEAGPRVYTIVFENEQVRVLSVTYQPGTRVPMHRHPDHVVFSLDGGVATFVPAGSHDVAGATATRALFIELGIKPGSPLPAGDDPVATYPRVFKLLLDEARVRVMGVTFGKGTSRPVALGDHVLVARDKGTLVVTRASGAARTLALEPGKVELFPAGVYTATNPKKESFEVVLFEFKP